MEGIAITWRMARAVPGPASLMQADRAPPPKRIASGMCPRQALFIVAEANPLLIRFPAILTLFDPNFQLSPDGGHGLWVELRHPERGR